MRYFERSIYCILLAVVFSFCLVSELSAQDSLNNRPASSNLLPATASLFVPGLGQMAKGEWLRGGFFAVAEGFLIGDAYYYWENQYNKASWDDAGRVFDRDMARGLVVWYGAGAAFTALDALYIDRGYTAKNPTLAALRSVIFPGWGQLANGKPWKAAVVFIGQTSLAFSAFYQHENHLFHDALGEESQARFYKDNRNRLIWWSVGAMILSAVDAFVDCHLRDWDVSPDITFEPTYFPEYKTFGFQVRFPINLN
ncbi:hypothetical protein CEE37_05540 [candidate division LCP-89 bacterium B3_LCP]|uniref:DUF5683 domain-containing protein n=1 Tax=candidate division LCP-89 bacterium B3_LCP TaxID=2012998 RepID=A0A532V1Y2_UNCL8|nr:MAG: hypothetical protein CEE37_05540 [candidate division LCP-89 bacterium B3_LCP]